MRKHEYWVRVLNIFKVILFVVAITLAPISQYQISAVNAEGLSGEKLFMDNCSGCHVNGGNIIRRGKNLKMPALQRNGIDNPEAIARIAREGVGSMDGYKKFLGEEGDVIVANWIWLQAQKAWTQG
mgnify:CR=1 FL=1